MKHLINKNLFLIALFILGIASCDNSDTQNKVELEDPVMIDCSYFSANPGIVLSNNPNAPIDYVVTCKSQIYGDVTVETGTVIVFENDAGFVVRETGASLSAVGTSDKPITFTGKTKSKGFWAGIIFYSNNPKNKLENVVVEYAGGSSFNSNNDKGAVIVYANAQLHIKNSKITNSSTYGLNASYNGATITLDNNHFTGNETPMVLKSIYAGVPNPTDNYMGNTNNYVELSNYSSELKTPATLRKINVPYRFTRVGNEATFHIKSDLTITAGTTIEMDQGIQWKVNTAGSLKAIGTSEQPIIIKGANATAGYWKNIHFEFTLSPSNQLKYVQISHAGADPTTTKGAIYMWAKPYLLLDNVTFKDILTCALYSAPSASNPNPNLNNSNLIYTNVGGQICGD